jgi:raffinose/stachyose/melibiose transport system permease protein
MAIFSLGPLIILLMNSLKKTGEIAASPLALPIFWRWDNFAVAWTEGKFGNAMFNSLILIIFTVLGIWFVAGTAAYSLARLNPPGKDLITMYLLVGISLPAQAMVFVVYSLWARIHLTDNLMGLIPIYIAGNAPFSTFLLRSFMVSIPQDFDDAARVDGASNWNVFLHVIGPLTWPGFLTVGLLTALSVWNEFFWAVTFIRDPLLQPVPIKLISFVSQNRFQDWGLISAASVITIVPVTVIFLILQRTFIEGLTQGGLKG